MTNGKHTRTRRNLERVGGPAPSQPSNDASSTAPRTSARFAADRTGWRLERSSFVGRSAQLQELRDYIEDGARLITIFGAPGLGKTRLLRRLGGLLADEGMDVEFCDLTAASSLGDVLAVVARALEIPLVFGVTAESVSAHLGSTIATRGRFVLLLDNFEQLVAHTQATIGNWLSAAPRALFLVTSREMLGLEEEVRFELPPLDPLEGVRLFEDRVQMDRSATALSEADRAALSRIVEKLDGIPLALELAAARIPVLSPSELAERLDARFALLRTQRRDVPDRHATLERAIDWSYELLAPWERAAFAQCAVFRGGFRLDAAEAVLSVEGYADAPPVLDVLQALRHKSLVRRYAAPGSSTSMRFGLYESLREYADRKLDDAQRREAEARHARFYVEQAEAWVAPSAGLAWKNVLERLRLESDNLLRVVHSRAVAPTLALRAALALDVLLAREGPMPIRRGVLDAVAVAAECSPSLDKTIQYFRARANMEMASIHMPKAFENLTKALEIARRAEDRRAEAGILCDIGYLELLFRQRDAARAHYREAAEVARRCGAHDRVTVAPALYGADGREGSGLDEVLTLVREMKDPHARAQALRSLCVRLISMEFENERVVPILEEGSRAAREAGNSVLDTWFDTEAAGLSLVIGRPGYDLDRLRMNLARAKAAGDLWGADTVHLFLGPLLQLDGRFEEARFVLEEWLAHVTATGYDFATCLAAAFLGALEAECGHIDAAERHFRVVRASARNGRCESEGSLGLLAGVFEIAHARAAAAGGQRAAAESHYRAARRRLDTADARRTSKVIQSDITAWHILERVITDYEAIGDTVRPPIEVAVRAAPPPEPSAAPALDFELAIDGRWFRTPQTGLVSMGRRQAQRRILLRLVEQRLAAPGKPLTAQELIEAGWPGERMQASAALNRFYNAIAVLRSLGLREVLVKLHDGYAIDPQRSVGWSEHAQ